MKHTPKFTQPQLPFDEVHNGRTLAGQYWKYCVPAAGNACWGWSGNIGTYGYGRFRFKKMHVAHRASWEIHYGPIPDGLKVLHKCDNPPCTNPEHLFLGTDADNAKDRNQKQRHQFGERHWYSRLTPAIVKEMRKLHKEGLKAQEIATLFSVSRSAVFHVIKRRTWKHID